MGKLILPNRRLERPASFRTNIKPFWPFEIDKDHWAGSRVLDYIYRLDKETTHPNATNERNIISVSAAGNGEVLTSRITKNLGVAGFALSFIIVIDPKNMDHTADAATLFEVLGSSGRNYFRIIYNRFSSQQSFQITARGNFGGTVNVFSLNSISSDSDLNKPHVIAGVISQNYQALYDNGVLVAETTAAVNTFTVSDMSITGQFLGQQFTGNFSQATFFDGLFSSEQLKNLSNNLYQMLIPA
jgi:hypothetical protein